MLVKHPDFIKNFFFSPCLRGFFVLEKNRCFSGLRPRSTTRFRRVKSMSVLIGGGMSVMLGLVLLIFWYKHFLVLLMGAAPILLILGGALAVYVGLDELKDKIRETQEKEKEELNKARAELERAKAEADKYREELEKLKDAQ